MDDDDNDRKEKDKDTSPSTALSELDTSKPSFLEYANDMLKQIHEMLN